MKLNIKDRIYFPQLLPQNNSYMDFNLKKSILAKVALTDRDKETYNIQENQDQHSITWDSKKDHEEPLEVEFSKEELAYLRKACEGLSDTAYPDDFWSVVEKIYENGD